jgi:hypothetical protein
MVNEAQNYVNTFGSLKGFPLLAPKTAKILRGLPDNAGAKLMLEVNQQATDASGIKLPADDDDQPTTAPPPRRSAGSSTGAGGATKTYRHTATDPQSHHQIGTDADDPHSPSAKWFDMTTGKPVQ